MKTEDLALFIDVMREGGFSRAAESRGVDPSSVSRAIAKLETTLGFRLFERTTRRFEPTEAGRLYYARIHDLVPELELAAARA